MVLHLEMLLWPEDPYVTLSNHPQLLYFHERLLDGPKALIFLKVY